MIKWQIEYWDNANGKSPIEEWLDELTKDQLKAVVKELKLLESDDNTLRLPHSRPLEDGLFELRERRFGYRIYYCFHGKRLIILLAAGDKKSQERDIKMARKRLSQL